MTPEDAREIALKLVEPLGIFKVESSPIFAPLVDRITEALLSATDAERAKSERYRAALEVIAGRRQGIDNLMSNPEIAEAALSASPD